MSYYTPECYVDTDSGDTLCSDCYSELDLTEDEQKELDDLERISKQLDYTGRLILARNTNIGELREKRKEQDACSPISHTEELEDEEGEGVSCDRCHTEIKETEPLYTLNKEVEEDATIVGTKDGGKYRCMKCMIDSYAGDTRVHREEGRAHSCDECSCMLSAWHIDSRGVLFCSTCSVGYELTAIDFYPCTACATCGVDANGEIDKPKLPVYPITDNLTAWNTTVYGTGLYPVSNEKNKPIAYYWTYIQAHDYASKFNQLRKAS